MASKRLQREYPSLSSYLDADRPGSPVKSIDWRFLALVGAGLVAVRLLLNELGLLITQGSTWGMMLVAGAAVGGFYFWQARKKSQIELTPEEKLLIRGDEARATMRKADAERRLLKHYDPIALQLLDAGAEQWRSIRAAFSHERWAGKLPDHWVSLRVRALAAADICMAQLAILCSDCYSENPRTRKDDFGSAFEDFADLEIINGLQILTKVIRDDPEKYRVRSPRTHEIYAEASGLVEQLQSLAKESAGAAREARLDIADLNLGQESVRSVLEEMRFVRTAEAEIETPQHERT